MSLNHSNPTVLCLLTAAALCPAAHADTTGLGRHKQLYAVPAPNPIAIDGKLDDWDLSGQIEMFVVSEGKESQGARFALMYDKEAVYLSGVVRDTTPMMNRQDPKVNGERGWDADSCQFRLTVDPAQAYPVQETTFDYQVKDAKPDTRDDIKHLTLWYYTDRAEPALQMHMGMTYRTPRTEWSKGVVPPDQFSAKYVKAEDGKGYTFEYRIPWDTLGAKNPLKGGDMVAGTVQFNWGTADGLKTGGGAAWAYDVMRGPGFVFQNAGVWGKLFFSATGKVSQALVEAGVPKEKPLPLKFAYTLPRDGQVTLQLVDENKLIRRSILAQANRLKGENVELWDGMDDQGKPLPPGNYTCRGIIHDPITSEFLFSVHNSGAPPYPTADNKGGWGGDHGKPRAVSAVADGLLLSWDGCEYGWGVIKVDLQGRKQWGIKSSAVFLANDGKRFFAYDPHGFQAGEGVRVFDAADGRPLNFGSGNPMLEAPDGGTKETNVVSGLATVAGKVFVSYGQRNLIGVFDSESGKALSAWAVPKPGALAARPDGSLLAISNGALVSVTAGKIAPLAKLGLDQPSGLALGPDGAIYVTNRGVAQDVAVLNGAGKLLRRIGKAGGRPAIGNYDNRGMYSPDGLAVDATGKLWVAEDADAPKRISVWDSRNGKFEREYFGGSDYFGYAGMNPKVPSEIYGHNVLWKVDWQKKTTTPISTIWRRSEPDMMDPPFVGAYPQGFRMFTATNGKQYGWGLGGSEYKSILYRREGNVFKPFFASFAINRGSFWSPFKGLGSAEIDKPENTPDGWYFWQDQNDDQRVQLSELYRFKDKDINLSIKDVAPDLTIWTSGARKLLPIAIADNGRVSYDPEKVENSPLTGTPAAGHGYLWLDTDESVYTLNSGQRPSLAKWDKAGKLQWGYPSIPGWHDSLSLPMVKPGRLHGMTGPLGVAGNFTGNMTYFGVCHLFQKDGTYAAAVFKDGRAGVSGAELGQPEGQGGQMVSVVTEKGGKPRTLVLAGGQDGRVTEVHGLETIVALPERTFTLTVPEVQIAADALAKYNASIGLNSQLTIASERKLLETATPVGRDLDGVRSFKVAAARDDKNLYLRYEINSPNELVSAMTDPTLVFKGGNVLDLQIATDPMADAGRKTPAPGDLRLLVTRRAPAEGQPLATLAVLYRPKVAGFTGQPTVLSSPTGKESFDAITVVNNVGLEYAKTGSGFTAVVTVPLDLLGASLPRGARLKLDAGYIFGNATGTQVAARSYWTNNSFSANVTNDIPNESRLEPGQWGTAVVE